jgi:DNA repair protein RecN (Recombination protein N)
MPDARFTVEFEDLPAALGGGPRAVLTRDGSTLGPEGRERVEFHLAANPGEGARPLVQVASGGELSRIMLALRHVAGGASVPTLVFDEVDAGIGGAAAETVGRRLHSLGRRHQVVCITHLAQIAAFADQHYTVVKSLEGSRTRTSVRRVEGEERVVELARMLAGADPGEEGLRYAREMIRRTRESVSADGRQGAAPRRRAARQGA